MASHRRTRAAATVLTAVLLACGTAACAESTPEADEPSPTVTESESATSSPSESTEPTEPTEPTDGEEALDSEEYIDQLNEVQQTFTTEAGKLNLANPESPRDFQQSLEKLVGPIETLTSDLQEITPPTEVAEEHEQLIVTMEDYRDAIVENVDGLSGNPREIKDAAEAIGRASTEFSQTFDRVIDEINTALDRG